ncbi:MAG: DUF4012 domain-containing protein [Patescibacteria group bacterium]
MGENKKYYHIKRKTKSFSRRVNFATDQPEVILQSALVAHGQSSPRVLNLDFDANQPRFWVGLIRWLLFIIFAALVYLTGIFSYSSGQSLKEELTRKGETASNNLLEAANSLQKMEIDTALAQFQIADKNFTDALGLFADLGQSHLIMADWSLSNSEVWQGQNLLLGGQHLARAGVNLTSALRPLVTYWDGLTVMGSNFNNAGEQIGQILLDNTQKIELALVEVRLADEALRKINIQSIDPSFATTVLEAQNKTQSLREAMEILGSLAKRLPNAMGFGIPQNYLFLNQNNNELRPTGGFIGSVALIELSHGKITNISADTSQRLDGQNKYSDMVLPDPLKAITSYYGIRDANWEPNFPTSAQTINKLYQQAGGGSVDGMIALTPEVITDILSITGPIDLPQYNLKLSADNFVEKTQKQIEIADQNLSDNPKQILIDFMPILMNRLMSTNSRELRLIGQSLFNRLINKDILIYFNDPQLEKVMTALSWSGEVNLITSNEDYLYVVEANIGGNKSSASIVREMKLLTQIQSDAVIKNSFTIRYTHTGSLEYPDGISRNYIRVYVPMGSHITDTLGQDADTQIDINSADGKTVVGFWLTINPNETKEIKIDYTLPFELNFSNAKSNYILHVQKQPGVNRTTLSHYIEVADNMDLAVNSGSDAIRKDMTFSDKLTKDESISAIVRKYH